MNTEIKTRAFILTQLYLNRKAAKHIRIDA